MAETFGIVVKKFHTDNGIFAEEGFKSDVSNNNQTISYCGVGAHFQNGTAEVAIIYFYSYFFVPFSVTR